MPKKRKNDAEDRDSLVVPVDSADVEVKTEQPSQEESKEAPQELDENDKEPEPAAVRTLRPRKTTCYAEDSPEINYDEKYKKVPRRKRRNTMLEDGSEEKEPKVKRTEKVSEEPGTTCLEKSIPLEADKIELPLPTLVSCTVLLSENPVAGKLNSDNNGGDVAEAEDGEGKMQQTKQPTSDKKRAKKKPKPKQSYQVNVEPDLVPKTEPISPSAAVPEFRETVEGREVESSKSGGNSVITTKPKPKKRIRTKKLAVLSTTENGTMDDKSVAGEAFVIKQETGESEQSKLEETSRSSEISKVVAEDQTKKDPKKVNTAGPRKKPVKKKPKPTVIKDPLDKNSVESNVDKSTEQRNLVKTEVDATKENIDRNQKTPLTTKKRAKSRQKKPATAKIASSAADVQTTIDANPEEDDKENKEKVSNSEVTAKSSKVGEPETKTRASVSVVRKPFFRGRRSKSFSARSGRKEIIHQVEEIDPEDIRGFEHVEKYVTPPGVRLPKFWDSEDEMSEDESNDNFRRIMCGFGTNCRIHEVIRPASEIVRRLKELQNTFGATKSLPLFQKDVQDSNEELWSVTSEPFSRKNDKGRNITWHYDSAFFKFANNYPSKCK